MTRLRHTVVLIAALMPWAPAARAQALHGTVTDTTGAAITNATVDVGERHARTGATGRFAIREVNPPASVSVSANGFSATTVPWSGSDLNIVLLPAPLQQQVVVTAGRTAAPLGEVSASVSRISSDEVAAAPAPALDDVLRQVPGFSLFRRSGSRSANPTSQGVSLRGLGASGASRALVLYDGVPLNDPFGAWVYWDRVPATDIGTVEVLRGGGSALYGSGALAGVVNVARRDFSARRFVTDLSLGNRDAQNGSASYSDRFGSWGIAASMQGMKTSGYIPVPADLRGRVDADANVRYGTGRVRVEYYPSFGGVIFAAGNLFNEGRQNGTVLQTNSTRMGEGIIGYDGSEGPTSISLRGYSSAGHFNQTFSSISADRNTETLVRYQQVPAQQLGLSGTFTAPVGNRNTLTFGGDFRRVAGHSSEVGYTRGSPSGASDAGGRQLFFGVFAEDMLRLGSRLHITASTRVDSWRNYDARSTATVLATNAATHQRFADRASVAFSPSLGAVVRISDIVSLTASAYGAFRTPTLNELYRGFRLGNIQTNANDALRAERLRGVEGGVLIGSGPVSAHATYFWNSIHDAIGNRTLSLTPTLIMRQRQNFGDLLSQGIELEAQARLPHHAWVRGSYEYSNSTVSRSLDAALLNLRIPQVPRHTVSSSVGYDGGRWAGSLLGRYAGSQFEDDQNHFLLPGYFTADATFRLRLSQRVEPYVACENLLDRGYIIGRSPTPNLGPPRLVRAGIRITFVRN